MRSVHRPAQQIVQQREVDGSAAVSETRGPPGRCELHSCVPRCTRVSRSDEWPWTHPNLPRPWGDPAQRRRQRQPNLLDGALLERNVPLLLPLLRPLLLPLPRSRDAAVSVTTSGALTECHRILPPDATCCAVCLAVAGGGRRRRV